MKPHLKPLTEPLHPAAIRCLQEYALNQRDKSNEIGQQLKEQIFNELKLLEDSK